jgi:ankyrin repeat protein
MDQDLLEEYIVTGNAIELYALLNSNPKLAIQKTSHQISPLLLCCYYKKPELADIILKHVPEISIFEAAALGKNDHITNLVAENPGLVHEFSDDGFTPLSLAAYFGNEDVIRPCFWLVPIQISLQKTGLAYTPSTLLWLQIIP